MFKSIKVPQISFQNVTNLLPIISLLVAIPVLSLAVWQQTTMYKVHYYEKLANSFAPSTNEAMRYRAIAQAIKEGKTTYSYASTRGPSGR